MAKGSGTISITIFDDSKTLDDQKCSAKYFEVLEVIEGKIKEFNKQTHNGCEEWLNINEHINNKEKELTECYKQNFLTVDLNHSKKVKAFRDQRANYPECSNKPAYSAEVPVKLKAKTEHSCGAKKDCTEITEPGKQKSELKEKESKSKPGVGTRTPETGTAKGQTLLQTGHSPAHGEEPGQEKLIPPVSRVTNPSDKSAQTHVETVQSRENHLSNKPEQLENFTQSSLALETPAGQTDTSSSKNSSAEDSDPNGRSEAVGLNNRDHQSNSDGGASSDSNLDGLQAPGKTDEESTHGNKGFTEDTSDDEPSSLKATAHRANVEENLVRNEYKGADTEGAIGQSAAVSPVRADSVNLFSESSGDGIHAATPSSGEHAPDAVIDNEGSTHTGAVREGNGDKTPARVTLSAKCTHSECTYDRNLNQPVTSNNASHYKTVVDDTFVGGDGSGVSAKDIRRAGDHTHHSLAVTTRTSIGGNSSDLIVSLGEQANNSFLPKAASVQSQEGKGTGNGAVHQDAQCPNENPHSTPKACQNSRLFNSENVHEQQQRQREGVFSSSQGLAQMNHTCTVGNIYPQGTDQIHLDITSKGASLSAQNCSNRVEGTEETANSGDSIIMLFKKHILMILIPLAIILLLTVLIKFTPLGMIFSSKKRKKQKDINAKLQRILQEPSMARDQRSVPFSYSSFEYSSY